jgi:hypothetical protein
MIDLALHCDVARRIGGSPPNIFNEVAERLAECPIADLLRHFGARTDINLEAFGSDLMEARRDWLSSPRSPETHGPANGSGQGTKVVAFQHRLCPRWACIPVR